MHTLLAIIFLVLAVAIIDHTPGYVWAYLVTLAIMAVLAVGSWYVLYKVIEKLLYIALKIKG